MKCRNSEKFCEIVSNINGTVCVFETFFLIARKIIKNAESLN